MAVAIQFLRNRPPHYAGEKIGTDRVTADKLIQAGYARAHDLDGEARATRTAEPAEPAKGPDGKGSDAKGPDGKGAAAKAPDGK